MKYESVDQAREALAKYQATMAAYNHALGVLFHDGSTVAPKESWAGRGQTMGVMSQILYDLEKEGRLETKLSYLPGVQKGTLRPKFTASLIK